MKKILTLSLVLILSIVMAVPSHGLASAVVEVIDNEYQEISITVNSGVLHIVGANGHTLYIYNVAGARVMSMKVDGMDCRFEINLPKGCYIVKAGKTVRKISIR